MQMWFRGILHVTKSKHHQSQSAVVERSSRCFSVLLTSAPPPVVSCFSRSTNTHTKTTAKGWISLSPESHNCQTSHSMLCQCIDIRATGNVCARVLFKEAISTPSTRGSLMQCSRKPLRVRYSKPRVQPCKLNTLYLCNSCQSHGLVVDTGALTH